MSGGQYGAPLAAYYDALNSSVDYSQWCDFLCGIFDSNGVPDGGIVLDLACGTGSMTFELAARGYDLIAVDSSPSMLSVAISRSIAASFDKRPLFLEQDMRRLDLYGTVDAAVCCLDGVNYLLKKSDVDACFSGVRNYLNPGGIFIFDVNTPYKFRNIYADRSYILEADGVFCAWENRFDEKSGLCEFDLTIFAQHNGMLYRRFDEIQRERMYSEETLRQRISAAGLQLLAVCAGPGGGGEWQPDKINGETAPFVPQAPTPDCERWHFICKKPH